MNKQKKIGFGIAGLALILLLAVLGYHLLAPRYQPQEKSASSSPQSSQSLKNAAPDFTVQDENGNRVSLSDFKGKPVVLNFWASWCPPCRAEMPDYEKAYRQYGSKGIVFLMVNLTDGSRETVSTAKQFLKEEHYTFPAYFDTKFSASDAYSISGIPDSVFINRSGAVTFTETGTIDSATLQSNLQKILK